MSDKPTRMLDYLSQTPAWVTAGELADLLGVTPRTVRSYITALKSAAHPLEVIESGAAGYRLDLLRAFDAFPQTHHVEVVTRFERV